ncbi:hypothetical protein Tco_1460051 [Tanacetum coccineum]
MAGPITSDYIFVTRKSFVSNDNDENMIEKNFIEIEGTFLLKIHDNAFKGINGENVFEHINSFLEVVEPLKVRGLTFEEFNYLLKIDPDLFTYDIQELKTYDDYEHVLNTNKTQGLNELWSNNGVPYQFCDHICEPYRFKNGMTKWPTCSSDINGYCNGGGLPGMVRIGVMKFCTWLKDSFKNFHKLDYDVLVKLKECWWKVSINEICPFTRWDNQLRGPYANAEPNRTFDPYLDNDRISGRNYETNNVKNVQDGKGHMENLTHESSACKIKRFKIQKLIWTHAMLTKIFSQNG